MAESTSLVTRASSALRSLFRPRQKEAPGGGYWLPIGGGYLPPGSPWNYWQLGYPQNGFAMGQSAVVAACVAAYAQTVAMCPGTHWRKKPNNGRERVTNSALSRILKQPNSYQSISDFLLNLTDALYTDGNAYGLAVRNARFEVQEIHLFQPQMSRPMVAADGSIFYSLGGNWIAEKIVAPGLLAAAPARDVLHIKLNSQPAYPLIGEPPITAALLDVAASDMMVRQALNFATNQSRPSGVIQTDLPMNRDQMTEARAVWEEMTTGQNAGRTPILANGLKWESVSSTGRDAQIAELLQLTDQRIASAYRVPLALLSLMMGQMPQASTEGLIQFWLASGLGFALNHIEEAIGRFFGLGGYPDEYLELDTRALERSNLKDRLEALARGVQGGIYSPNEARAMEDLPAAEDGDEPRVQQQVVPLSFGAKPPPAPAPAPVPNDNQPQTEAANAAGYAASIRRAAERYRRTS